MPESHPALAGLPLFSFARTVWLCAEEESRSGYPPFPFSVFWLWRLSSWFPLCDAKQLKEVKEAAMMAAGPGSTEAPEKQELKECPQASRTTPESKQLLPLGTGAFL